MLNGYDAVKLFSATKANDRERLGETITAWLDRNPDVDVVDTIIRQSSDDQFHCVSITLFYNRP